MLNDKQKEEINKEIYEWVQQNFDDLTVFEDYWHGMTCSDGTVLDINIYDSDVDVVICSDGTLLRSPYDNETGLRLDVDEAPKGAQYKVGDLVFTCDNEIMVVDEVSNDSMVKIINSDDPRNYDYLLMDKEGNEYWYSHAQIEHKANHMREVYYG